MLTQHINAVLGGGVVGCAVAWHIAERGLGEVVLLERDMLGSGTTWHSAANITVKAAIFEECADVPLYFLLIAARCDIDLLAAALEKINKNALKCPVEKARGNARKYTEL